ncbi:hypothetical protein QBC40DRAFT_325380, partial [Triangularia verruculosa]
MSIAWAVERHVRNFQGGNSKKEHLRSILEDFIPRGLLPILVEAVSCVYTYLLQRWKRVIEKTRGGYGVHTHEATDEMTGDCTACQVHDCNVERWANRAIIHGPEALFTQLSTPPKATDPSEQRQSKDSFLSFLYDGEISSRDDYPWPLILYHLQTTISNGVIEADTSKQYKEMVRTWERARVLWNMLENRRVVSTILHEDPPNDISTAWITGWYAHRHVRHHESWALEGLTMRGWVFWADQRVEKLGWSKPAMAGWLAKGQPGWWDECEKWNTINSYA